MTTATTTTHPRTPSPVRRGVLIATLLLGLLGRSGGASAQSAADKAAAEQLFKQARALMSAKKFDEACPKLEASLRLDAALGTRLNLASCYEEVGKLASAWGMYHEAEDLASNENQPKRVQFAREHAKALEPRLPTLVIVAPAARELVGLKVTRDGTVIDAAVFGSAIYIDPGAHTIAASAPGYKSFSVEITAQEGKRTAVEVPALEAEPTPMAEPSEGASSIARGATVRASAPVDPGRTRRVLGLGVGGAGVVAVAVGLGFGVSARSKWNQALDDNLCDKARKECTPAGQELADTARSRATIATIAVGAGAALLATGAVLYFTAPRADRRSAQLVPTVTGDAVGVTLLGGF